MSQWLHRHSTRPSGIQSQLWHPRISENIDLSFFSMAHGHLSRGSLPGKFHGNWSCSICHCCFRLKTQLLRIFVSEIRQGLMTIRGFTHFAWSKPFTFSTFSAAMSTSSQKINHFQNGCRWHRHIPGTQIQTSNLPFLISKNGWFWMEHTTKMDDWGVPLFYPILGNHHMLRSNKLRIYTNLLFKSIRHFRSNHVWRPDVFPPIPPIGQLSGFCSPIAG